MLLKKSISSRLFFWLLLSGLLALGLAGVGLYLEVRNINNASLDHSLLSDLEIFTGLLHIENGELEFEYTEAAGGKFSIPRSGHYYQIFLEDEVFTDSISLVGERLEVLPAQLVENDPLFNLKIYTGVGPAQEPLRIMERLVEFGGFPARVVVAHTQTDNLETLSKFRDFLLFTGALSGLFIAMVGWQISRRALQPLNDFSVAINQVSEKTLDQRIDAEEQYRELSSLATAFNGMLDRLRKSLRAREELLSVVSHELKTPVAVIRGHCDVYLQRQRSAGEYVEALEIIRDSADSMGDKISRLLNVAKTEAELISLSGFPPLAIDSCLRKARLTVEPLAREKKIEFSEQMQDDLMVAGHEERLTEAFSCLLENAVKYNRPEGLISICAEQDENQVLVKIEDNGCGIDPQELDKIFKRFYRGSRTQKIEGTGLGLVLVKAIVDAHSGNLAAENLPEGGSRFSIRLPLV